MKSSTFDVSVQHQGHWLRLVGTYYPGSPDVFYLPNGDPGYPGDPAEAEFQAYLLYKRKDGRVVEREIDPEPLYDALFELIGEYCDEMAVADECDRADAKAAIREDDIAWNRLKNQEGI